MCFSKKWFEMNHLVKFQKIYLGAWDEIVNSDFEK